MGVGVLLVLGGGFAGGGQDGAAQDVGGHGEAEEGRGGVGRNADGLDVQGVHHGEVAVGAVAGRRGGTDVAGGAGVVGQLEGALGQAGAGVVAGALGQVGDGGGDVGDRPVPEPGSTGGVGVVDGDGVALGAFGGAAPGQLRGGVLAAGDAEDAGVLLGRQGAPSVTVVLVTVKDAVSGRRAKGLLALMA